MTEYDPELGLAVAFPKEEPRQRARRGRQRRRADPAAHRRDREVRARDLLLQRRAGRAVPGRAAEAHPVSEGRGHLRPEAGHERLRGGRVFQRTIMQRDPVDFVVLNFANPDMVGHTGNMAATVEAVRACGPVPGQRCSRCSRRRGRRSWSRRTTATPRHAGAGRHHQHRPHHQPRPADGRWTETPVLREGAGLADVAPTLLCFLGLDGAGRDDRDALSATVNRIVEYARSGSRMVCLPLRADSESAKIWHHRRGSLR